MNLIILITKGILHDQHSRRMAMSMLIGFAVFMLVGGVTLFEQTLRENPRVFVVYWCICGWITVCAALLSIYDLLSMRMRTIREKRSLKSRHFTDDNETK